jgi:hypothetical protein
MNNKKGRLILESSVKLVISVLVLVMLIGLLIAVYYILVAENELQKIKKQMDKLEEITKKVHQSGKLSTIDFFPIKGWYLKTFNIGDEGFGGFPIGACVDNRAESCLCVCDKSDCKEKFDCRWFDFKVFIAEEHRVTNFPDATEAQMGYSPPDDVYSGTFQLRESIYQFEIAKGKIGSEEWVSIVEPGITEKIKRADLDNFLNTMVSFDGEKVKILDIIKYSLDPFYEVRSTEGSNIGRSFAETKFRAYGNQNGLEILSFRYRQDYLGIIEREGFRTTFVKDKNGKTTEVSTFQLIQSFIVDFEEKSEEFKVLVRELNKICENYMLLMPQGVIYRGKLRNGPGAKSSVWDEQFAMDWKGKEIKINYVYDLGVSKSDPVDFKIKLKFPDSCFK